MKHTPLNNTSRANALSILLACLGCLLVLAFSAGSAFAQVQNNDSIISGDWFDTAVWSTGTVPVEGDGLRVRIQGNDTVSLFSGTATGEDTLRIADGTGNFGELEVSGSSTSLTFNGAGGPDTGNTEIGSANNDTGILTIQGGRVSFSGQRVDVGVSGTVASPDGQGIINQSGGTFSSTGEFNIGRNAYGEYNLSGGVGSINNLLRLGQDANQDAFVAEGVMNVTGGTFVQTRNTGANPGVRVGERGKGTINLSAGLIDFSNGGLASNNDVFLGDDVGTLNVGEGYVNISGGTMLVGRNMRVGDRAKPTGNLLLLQQGGTGIVNVTGGLLDVAEDFRVAQDAGSYGSAYVASGGVIHSGSWDGTLDETGGRVGEAFIGVNSTGVLTIDDGGLFRHTRLENIPDPAGNAQNNGGDGDVIVGVGAGITNGVLFNSQGELNITGGTLEADGELRLGQNFNAANQKGSLGSMFFSGGAVLVGRDGFNSGMNNSGGNLIVGNNGSGLLTVAGGEMNILRTIFVGQENPGYGSVLITGGNLTNVNDGQGVETDLNDSITVGNSGYGEVTIDGGTLQSDASINVGANSSQTTNNRQSGTGVINLKDGLLKADTNAPGGVDSNGNIQLGNLVQRRTSGDASTIVRGEGTLNQTGGLSTANSFLVGNQGDGYLNMSGGTLGTQAAFILGNGTTLSTINGGPTTVRQSGSGFATISGGEVNIDDNLRVANVRESYGSLLISGGLVRSSLNTANTDHIEIGGNGETTPGTDANADFNSEGYLTVNGGTLINSPTFVGVTGATEDDRDILIGFGGSAASLDTANFGQLTVDSGLVQSARHVRVAINNFNKGRLEVNGGTLTADDFIRVGDGNDTVTSFVQTGGVIVTDLAGESGGDGGDGRFDLGEGARSTALGTMTGGIASINGVYRIAVNADSVATMDMSGGTILAGDGTDGVGGGGGYDVLIGNNASARGVLNLSGGEFNLLETGQTPTFQFGASGTGILNLSGTGLLSSNGDVNFGNNLNSYGELNMTGGEIRTDLDKDGNGMTEGDNVAFGLNGTGLGNISGGLISIPNNKDIRIGVRAGSYGSVQLSGTGILDGGELNVGEGSGTDGLNDAGRSAPAIGVFEQTGGIGTYSGNIFVGRLDDSTGTYIQTGGISHTDSSFVMANIGSIQFHTTATTTRFDSVFGAAEGSATITGGTLQVGNAANEDIVIGVRGTADMTIGGDAVVNVQDDIILGQAQDGVGTDADGAGTGRGLLNIGGSATVNAADLQIAGDSGTATQDQYTVGSVNISGGVTSIANQVLIARGQNRTGTLNQTGGTLNVGTRLLLGAGNNGVGTRAISEYSLSGGLLQLGTSGGGIGTIEKDNHDDSTLSLTGGTVQPAAADTGFHVERSGGSNAVVTLNEGAVIDMRNGTLTANDSVNRIRQTSGEFNNAAKVGHFNGDSGGNNTHLQIFGGLVRPSEDGTVRHMTIGATAGGTQLGDYTQSGGTWVVDLFTDGVIGDGVTDSSSDTSAANSSIIANDVDLTGATIQVVNTGSVVFNLNEQWDILGWYDFFGGTEGAGSLTGTPTFDFSMAGGAAQWDTSLFASSGVIQIIPEPSRFLLLFLGAGAIIMRRRRKA